MTYKTDRVKLQELIVHAINIAESTHYDIHDYDDYISYKVVVKVNKEVKEEVKQ